LRRSPHVTTLRERLAVNGQPIAPAAFAALVQGAAEDVAAAQREDARLSHFEALTALALRHFQQQQARLNGSTWSPPRPWHACVSCACDHTTLPHLWDAQLDGESYAAEGVRMWCVLATRPARCTAAQSTMRALTEACECGISYSPYSHTSVKLLSPQQHLDPGHPCGRAQALF